MHLLFSHLSLSIVIRVPGHVKQKDFPLSLFHLFLKASFFVGAQRAFSVGFGLIHKFVPAWIQKLLGIFPSIFLA